MVCGQFVDKNSEATWGLGTIGSVVVCGISSLHRNEEEVKEKHLLGIVPEASLATCQSHDRSMMYGLGFHLLI